MERVRKHIIFLFWVALTPLVFHYPAIAQTTVTLEEYETRNLVFTGHIGEDMDMPVTFFLNVENMSSGHIDWYSVSGWYQYDRHGKPIPLAGIYTGDLTLYRFAQEALADTLLNFRYDDYEQYSFMRMMQLYHDMEGFLEKMTIERIYGKFEHGTETGRTLKGEWTDGKKRLPLRVYRTDVDILQRHSLLNVCHNGANFRIALNSLNIPLIYLGDYSIAGYNVVDGKVRIVLSYDRPSKSYALGMCGAGTESGFLRLELDDKGHLLALDDYLIESCLKNVHYEPGYMDEHEENYIVTDGEGLGWFLRFNKKTMELAWEEGG